MSRRLVVIDRATPLLLPPSIQEWVAEDHIARFIVEAAQAVDECHCHFNWRGSGHAQYPPHMMLALLIYCYSHGVFSSRGIEQASRESVTVRFITGDTHPDHDTIATFRRENRELFHASFKQVLELAAGMQIGQMGTIAIDGSKLRAAASKRRTLTRAQIQEQSLEWDGVIRALEEKAEKIDRAEEQSGAKPAALPAALRQAEKRRQALSEALAAWERNEARRQEEEAQESRRHDPEGPGTAPHPSKPENEAEERVNLSDPQARTLKMKEGGSAPAYNVQLAVAAQSDAPLILATGLSDHANDRRQLEPMIERSMEAAPETRAVLVDSGYDNAGQIFRSEQKHGATVYCPVQGTRPPGSSRKSQSRQRTAAFREGMKACMRSEVGRQSQQRRATSVEPVFGWIKRTLGFDRFRLRGLAKAELEWELVCLGYNVRLLHRIKTKRARTAPQPPKPPRRILEGLALAA